MRTHFVGIVRTCRLPCPSHHHEGGAQIELLGFSPAFPFSQFYSVPFVDGTRPP